MDNKELKYHLTALIDGELSDVSIRTELEKLIASDPSFKEDYSVLKFTKSLVQQKCVMRETPEKLKRKIVRKIKPVENTLPQPLEFLKNIFARPVFAVSGAVVLVLLFLLFFINRNSTKETSNLAAEQTGTENMFVQAENNFLGIVEGKLTPQIYSDDEEEIKNFFSEHGVKYSTQIPKCKNWKLVGAVVSESCGEKFAHHVYANDKGELVYVFQVDESYLKKGEAVKLSEHMIEYLDEGNCYISTKNTQTTLMKKMDNNICAIVSNAPEYEIENLFCSL